MDNYIMLDGKKIPLTDEQVKMLKDVDNPKEVKKSSFERGGDGCRYYYISFTGAVECGHDVQHYSDNGCYSIANYCTDEGLMKQRALHETLNRLLWRFSMENGETDNPWDGQNIHWFISFSCYHDDFDISWNQWNQMDKAVGLVYFPSKSLAAQAIDEIVKPFMKEHPDFLP